MADGLLPRPPTAPRPRFWGLDGCAKADVRLLAAHLNALPDATKDGGWCFLNNHPISRVELLGIVISVDPKPERLLYTLDDGSGLIDCISWGVNSLVPAIGTLLHVLGSLSRFRGARQVRVERHWAETDPMAECYHWLRARQLWCEVYSQPFRIPDKALEQDRASGKRPRPGDGGGNEPASPVPVGAAILGQLLEATRSACARGDAVAGVSEQQIFDAKWAARSDRPPRAMLQAGLAQLVEQSMLYVVEDRGGRAGGAVYRLAVPSG